MVAVAHSLEEAVLLLLQQPDIDVNVKFANGNSLLHFAALHENGLPILNALLQHPQINVHIKDNNEMTPLDYLIIGENDLPKLHALLQHPAIEVNVKNNSGEYPLHAASEPALRILLQHPNIDINKMDKYGYDILTNLLFMKDLALLMYLLSDQRIALPKRLTQFNELIYWKKGNLAQAFWQSAYMTEQEKKHLSTKL
jgi:hypothetical protein